MKKKVSSRRSGFSLIEVNMAIFVLAGGALALLGLFPLGLRESLAARNEMRVAAFAERFLGAARLAATLPGVTEVADLQDALEGTPFNFTVDDDPGYTTDGNATKDDSGVWYRAWVLEDTSRIQPDASDSSNNRVIAEVGIRVTAENADQNKRALNSASTYMVRIFIDKNNTN